jgi:hypothetical protein
MNININLNNQEYTIFLYNFQYWNQRLFALGQSTDGTLFKKFISTKGFDKLLIESDTGPLFSFKKEHFSPYLCSREKPLWRESQLIDRNGKDFTASDIGPYDYSGNYEIVADLIPYRDDAYFETKVFTEPEFSLFKYQIDDLYFIQYQSALKDKMPTLTCLMEADLYNNINIIHGVTDNGSDIFDLNSLLKVIDTDLAYPEKNSLYMIAKKAKKQFILTPLNYHLDFYYDKTLDFLKEDCGNKYIRQIILHKYIKKNQALRYLYEYFNFTKHMMGPKRKQSTSTLLGPKNFKQNEFCIHFDLQDTSNFKIIYYDDVFTVDRKKDLSYLIPGIPNFSINGKYNFVTSQIDYDDFINTKQVIQYVKNNISIAQSIKLSKLMGQWLRVNMGYSPRISKISVSHKANSKNTVDNLTLYHVPIYGSDEDIYETETFVNLYEFLATFGIHIPAIRNLLEMNWFNANIFKSLDTIFSIYHVSRDYRRSLFNWDNDADMKVSMISIIDAVRLISLFKSIGADKNTYWLNNANSILTAFPDELLQPETLVPGDNNG